MKYILMILVLSLAACASDTSSYPDVSVSVADFIEYGDETGRIGRVILRVHNDTVVPVYSSSLSMEFETDTRQYYTTVYDDRGIPPGMIVFIVVEFLYISPDERATIDGVTVTDSYFM